MIKPCCQQPENLHLWIAPPPTRPDLVIRICQVCGCKHYELTADPGVLGLTLKGI